ncbi:MAG TPA: hypothetical protein VK928_05140 [Longimicrobiales bacterium]|nr:hypothetical protein [Longimicrobiales bacterium]
MRRLITFMAAAAMLAALPGAGAAQQSRAQEDASIAALARVMAPADHAELVIVLRDARARGLSVQPLIAKAQEGAAKNVPRIAAAVRGTMQLMVRAQALLQGPEAATDAEVNAVAIALQRGVPEDAIRGLSADARTRASIAVAAHVLGDLMAHGVPVAVGVEAVQAWHTRPGNAAGMNEIPAAVERLVRQGVVPARAGAAVAAGLRLGRTPGSITAPDVPRLLRPGTRGG